MKKSSPDKNFGVKLRELREELGLTIDEFCNQFNSAFNGRLNKSTVSRYENGIQEPMISTVKKLADFYAVDPSYFLGGKPTIYRPTYKDGVMPVLKAFKAGDSVEESENIAGYLDASSFDTDLAPFGLLLQDNSMAPRMCEGDLVIIARQYEDFLPSNGDIMAVSIKGGNAIVRNIIRSDPNGIWLLPSNPGFDSQFYTNEELAKLPVQFIGYVIELEAKIDHKKK